jgi:HAD superfamily hydrolase (TIGR01509 family)
VAVAALFDLNGTVVDDMRVHGDLWREAALALGADVPASMFIRDWAGAKSEEVVRRIAPRPLSDHEVQAIVAAKEARYLEVYRHRVAEVPGAVALVRRLRAAGVRLALATAAPAANRALALDGLGLSDAFHFVQGPEGIALGKPAPDIFLAAAAGLGAAPGDCIVFEDALNGVRAALAAGMRAVGVATLCTPQELAEVGSHWVIEDFRGLPPALERALAP